MDATDRPTTVRAGEELNEQGLHAFLKEHFPELKGQVSVRQFPSGYSNLTYLVTIGDRELILRRPPFGKKAETAHDMSREYRILSALHPAFPYCPKPLAYSEDPSIIGSPFYIMERIRGIILRRDLPPALSLTSREARQLCENLLDVLVALHGIDYHRIGLGDFGKPRGYVRRQVEGWSRRYRDARTPDAPDCEKVMAWVHSHMAPDTERPCIIHNDFKFDNVVLDPEEPTKIIGILDWEMSTIGDPLMELGNTLSYWVQEDDPAGMQLIRTIPSNMDGALTRRELAARYSEKSGRHVDRMDFYYCFGLFRLAVIAQQIYYRYYHGQTRDDRFKTLIQVVRVLDETARQVAETSEI